VSRDQDLTLKAAEATETPQPVEERSSRSSAYARSTLIPDAREISRTRPNGVGVNSESSLMNLPSPKLFRGSA